jgi:hypothetical protein
LDSLDRGQAVYERPPEEVQLRHHEAIALTSFNSRDGLHQLRAVVASARLVELLEDVPDLGAPKDDRALDGAGLKAR